MQLLTALVGGREAGHIASASCILKSHNSNFFLEKTPLTQSNVSSCAIGEGMREKYSNNSIDMKLFTSPVLKYTVYQGRVGGEFPFSLCTIVGNVCIIGFELLN